MQSQGGLMDFLIRSNILKKQNLINAFYKIDRADFIPSVLKGKAYINSPLPIGYEQTISQPAVVAFMLELLDLQKGDRVLDIGCGSGWTTALIAECVKPAGVVAGIEIIPELVQFGQENLAKYNFTNAKIIQAKCGTLGMPGQEAFDKILVSAAAQALPKDLLSQFTKRLVIPIEKSIRLIIKDHLGNLEEEKYDGFRFVPLVE